GFTDGNIRTGRLATWLNSAMWDAIQEEICGVIEKAGIELNKEEHDQLYKAILLLVGGAINEEALLIKNNLSDVEDKDEAVENLGLKPTVDKAKNAVQRDGDTMTGELKIRGVNALRIFNEAFGLIFRRSEECLHLIPTQENQGENGDIGPLRPFTMNLRTGEITMSKVSVGGDSQVRGALGIGVQNALGGNSIAFGDNDTGLKQNGDGLLDVYANGQHVFRFQNGALQSNRAVNVSGRVTPSDYGNFDARYQQRNGGVQDIRLGSQRVDGHYDDDFTVPSGYVVVGGDVAPSSALKLYSRPIQKLINGTWYNASSV
ncbi:phage tail protein, partial [Escherichia coli]|nr:phage tail protein [Escherichia coli]